MVFTGQVNDRRAIEALRNGVPNRDAVKALGCRQPDIQAKFIELLDSVQDELAAPNGKNSGMLIAGDFGSGKSHLLEHLMQAALEHNFVCSRVVVSKETPLFDPARLYRAAAEAAVVPEKRGNAMTEVVEALKKKFDSREYTDLYNWAHQLSGISTVFPAALYLIEHMASYPEVLDRIIRFLSGDKFNVGEIKRYLKGCGEKASYRFNKVGPYEFALQKFRFAARMIAAAGYAGWLLLIDEAELVARYSLLMRAKSYAEIGRWLGRTKDANMAGITAVIALTDDFVRTVIDEKDDYEKAPNRLRASANAFYQSLADNSEKGIKALRGDVVNLKALSKSDIAATYEKVREIYGSAYGWAPPPLENASYATSTRMRQYIRGWITEWDLMRLAPGYRPDIETEALTPGIQEDAELEAPGEEDPGEAGLPWSGFGGD